MGTAMLSSVVLGLLDLVHPVFAGGRYTLTPASPLQLWAYGFLQVVKPLGFLCGLYGLFLTGTRRGPLVKLILGFATVGGAWYAVVWIMIAITQRDDAIYVGTRAIGSDAHSNGGLLFLWLAPSVIGVATLLAGRIARWQAVWVVAVGVVGSQLFGLLKPGLALMVEGILWLGLGWIVYASRRGA